MFEMKLVVLDGYCLNPGDLSWDALKEIVEVEIHDRTPPDKALERLAGADFAMTNKTPLPAAVLRQLPQLRYIGVLATGYNIVDVAAAREVGITVTNIPTYGTASVAQFVFALLFELCHQVGMHSHAVRSGQWGISKDWSFWKSPLVELSGKTIGIVGFGRIGRSAAKIADAIGMRVLANDSNQTNPPAYDGFEWSGVDELLAQSDVVSLHCPLLPETNGLMNRERLNTMKRSAFLLNTSRGPLIVEQDLADALNNGVIAGAGLDVLPVEPPVAGSPLFKAKNCLITPHIAWATREARARLMGIAVDNLAGFIKGEPKNII
jgi:glycerate dehydrogenase